jgi:hypothetical protein
MASSALCREIPSVVVRARARRLREGRSLRQPHPLLQLQAWAQACIVRSRSRRVSRERRHSVGKRSGFAVDKEHVARAVRRPMSSPSLTRTNTYLLRAGGAAARFAAPRRSLRVNRASSAPVRTSPRTGGLRPRHRSARADAHGGSYRGSPQKKRSHGRDRPSKVRPG